MATPDDARLIIEFSRWAEEWHFYEANHWIMSEEYLAEYRPFVERYPEGSVEYQHVTKVLGYYENLGLFYKHGVIDRELLFDWLDFSDAWDRVASFAHGMRAATENPKLWANFERLVEDQQAWAGASHVGPSVQ